MQFLLKSFDLEESKVPRVDFECLTTSKAIWAAAMEGTCQEYSVKKEPAMVDRNTVLPDIWVCLRKLHAISLTMRWRFVNSAQLVSDGIG
jgi:hypothetical protein